MGRKKPAGAVKARELPAGFFHPQFFKVKSFLKVFQIVSDGLYFALFHTLVVYLKAVEKARNSRVFPCLAGGRCLQSRMTSEY